MAKDLPYFKFNVAEWLTGTITLEEYDTQGIFINICAYYWNKSGDVTFIEIKRRLKNVKAEAFDSLFNNGLMKLKNEKIIIKFLDEQLTERKGVSQINSQNGKLGGRPRKTEPLVLVEEKPNALFSESETIPKKSNIDKEEEIEKNKKKRKTKVFTPPILNDVVAYFNENGYTQQSGEKAFKHYSLGNWHDTNGKPVLNWKQKMSSVWFKNENKIIKPSNTETSEQRQQRLMKNHI